MTGRFSKIKNIANTRTLTLGSTWAFRSNFLNDFRFNASSQQGEAENNLELYGGTPFDQNLLLYGSDSPVNFSMAGVALVEQLFVGSPGKSRQRQIQLVENISITSGGHRIKFGIDFRRLNPVYDPRINNTISIPNLASLSNGTVNYIGRAFEAARPQFENYSLYVQDAWRATRRLSLDFGLRWEFNPTPTEADDRLPRIVTGIVDFDVTGAVIAPVGTPFYKTFYNAFAPRFGFAYQFREQQGSETVVRGGFGMYYDLGNGSVAGGWPFEGNKQVMNTPFPLSAQVAAPPAITTSNTTFRSFDRNLKLPLTYQWNLGVEQSFGKGQVGSLSYVAAVGRDLVNPITLNNPLIDPNTGLPGARPNPNFGSLVYVFNGPSSDYHSLQAQYRVRLRDRLNALVNYTWSHAIDEVSSEVTATALERGNADFDVRHNFSAAFTYLIPSAERSSFARALTRGWSLSGILHMQTAQPINIASGQLTRADGTRFSVRPDLVLGQPIYIDDPSVPGGRRFNSDAFKPPPNIAGRPNTPARQGTLGRNVLRRLPLEQVDLSLSRSFRFTETSNLMLKVDAFNVFNLPMFSGFDTNYLVRETFGVPFTTLNTGLGGLNQLFQLGGPRSIQLSARLNF